jgi:hypothetical protein
MLRLIRSLLAILIATVLIGAPGVPAAIAMPCDTIVASAADHQQLSGHLPNSIPCKEKMSGCTDMLGCGLTASLHARVTVVSNQPIWAPAVYWPVADSLEGLVLKPHLGPPNSI